MHRIGGKRHQPPSDAFDTSYGLPKAEGVKRITPNYSHNPQLKEATP